MYVYIYIYKKDGREKEQEDGEEEIFVIYRCKISKKK
jgi:hypothetical protein